MREDIKEIFNKDIELLSWIDKAVIYFREGRYDLALEAIAMTGDYINTIAEAIINNREYFGLVSTESVAEMLKNILEAKQHKDYVLLADLYEMQLCNFICSVQELIMKREDYFGFDEGAYAENTRLLEKKLEESLIRVAGLDEDGDELRLLRENQNAALGNPLDAGRLLEEGYSVELTSCGLMTVGAQGPNGDKMYLHTNGRVSLEAFVLAKRWYVEGADTYIIYGFGMGYHIAELASLAPKAHITVFESDMDILRLYCAFGGDASVLLQDNVDVVYDPDFKFIDKRLTGFGEKETFCIHYPSFRRVRDKAGRELLSRYIPWSGRVEEC